MHSQDHPSNPSHVPIHINYEPKASRLNSMQLTNSFGIVQSLTWKYWTSNFLNQCISKNLLFWVTTASPLMSNKRLSDMAYY